MSRRIRQKPRNGTIWRMHKNNISNTGDSEREKVIVELSKCLGCMEDFQGYPCPGCGYDPEKTKNAEYALTPGTILAGKYLVGKVLGQGG